MGDYLGLIFLAVPLLLIWSMITRNRRQQRLVAAAQASVAPGSWVMTTSGVHGRVITAGDGPTVVLEIAPGVHTRWARLAVAEVFDHDPAAAEVVDLTSDGPLGTAVAAPKAIGVQDDTHPDDRDDRTLT